MSHNSNEVIRIWDEICRNYPSPFHSDSILWEKLNPKFKKTYREKLDERKVNFYGEVIPRIQIVRNNLKALKEGNTMKWRGLDIKDRRQLVRRK